MYVTNASCCSDPEALCDDCEAAALRYNESIDEEVEEEEVEEEFVHNVPIPLVGEGSPPVGNGCGMPKPTVMTANELREFESDGLPPTPPLVEDQNQSPYGDVDPDDGDTLPLPVMTFNQPVEGDSDYGRRAVEKTAKAQGTEYQVQDDDDILPLPQTIEGTR